MLPTRDELNQMVDVDFRERYPSAPERLDPDDRSHAQYIAEWVAIRDRKATEWTDDVFASFFPDAGRLDPDDPRDRTLVDFWRDIHDQIRDGPPGRFDWSSFAPTSAEVYRRQDSGQPDEPDPVTPDVTGAVAVVHQARQTLAEIFAGTELAERVTEHLDRQVAELVGLNAEGGLPDGGWTSEPLDAAVPDPDSPDDPYFVRDLVVHARVDHTTFTVEANVTGSGSGPNGTLGS